MNPMTKINPKSREILEFIRDVPVAAVSLGKNALKSRMLLSSGRRDGEDRRMYVDRKAFDRLRQFLHYGGVQERVLGRHTVLVSLNKRGIAAISPR